MLITIIILVTIPTTVTPLIVTTSNNISTVPNTHHSHHGEESSETAASSAKCQEITIPMCKTIRYNYTEMPNSFNHETQEEAGLEVHQYWPLVEINCSEDLKFFICSIYVPICMEDYIGTVPPCKEVCERAKAGCEPVMRPYGFEWPQRMTCDQFPTYGKHSICMDERNGELPREQQQNHHTNTIMHNHISSTNTKTSSPHGNDHYQKSPKSSNKPPPTSNNACNRQRASCTCPSPLVTVNNSICSQPCHGYGYSSQEETNFAQIWLTFWSSTTLALSTITVFTFAINPTRFNYPERPIILISFSYVFVSIAYLIRIYYGHQVTACEGRNYEVIKYPGNNVRFHHHQLPSQPNSNSCLITFLLSYYFTIAGSCWYVVLTTTWYLASVLKWSTESISSYSKLFHLLVWTVSGTLTTRVLATNSVDGDGVSGLCGVGNQDNDNLLYYVVYPIGSMLCVGSVFLVSGFVSLVSLRRSMQRGGGSGRLVMRNFHKLEKLMMRIGVFGIIYSLDVGAVIGGLLYEGFWVKVEYDDQVGSCECNDDVRVTNSNGIMRPAYSLLMIKHFMSLATGLTASIWVFSSKTIETWKHFIKSKLFCHLCKSSSSSTAASDKQRLGVAMPTTTAPAAPTSTSTGTNSSLQNNTAANYRLQIHNASASSVHNHHHHHHFNTGSLGNGGGGSSTINHSNTQTHV